MLDQFVYSSALSIITPSVYIVLLVMFAIYDKRFHIVPNRLVYPGMVVALALSYFGIGIIPSLIGGVIMFALLLLSSKLLKLNAGMGDCKLALLIGLMLGYPITMICLGFCGVLSLVVGGFLLATKRSRLDDVLPFGTIMAVAAIATILWGYQIWQLATT